MGGGGMSDEDGMYRTRRSAVASKLKERGVAAVLFEDFEHGRDPSIRWLCGQPSDAFLVIASSGYSVLVAWDINMALRMGFVDEILAYTDFGRQKSVALKAVLEKLGIQHGSVVELPSTTSYPSYVDLVGELDSWDFICEADGIDSSVQAMRSIKDSREIALYRKISSLTDSLMNAIEKGVESGSFRTETDVALFIEREARERGAEGTGFETLAAGPQRSFGIHAFPSYGAGPFGTKGLSILDFGITVDGYTSDVTMSFAREPLTAKQKMMVDLVIKAHDMGMGLCGPSVPTRNVAKAIDEFFSEADFVMPHALGHGIGLEAHESPGINLRPENEAVLSPGNIVTIEPGLYLPEQGGVRLEDDVLITATGREALTHSRIVMM
jgi:Xaa-Pro dipeptidase